MDPVTQLNAALAGRYEIERHIGSGGMASVYLARDLKHNRKVALKLLNPELGAILGVERFLAEIQVTANLQHPNLLPLFDSGEAEGLLFYVMPYVDGESLRGRLTREKQLPVDEAVRIAVAIAGALAYAHQHGVIHRDLKPENILLQAGQPMVADFGIALAVSKVGGARITQTGLSLGTPQYMSPEQATGDRVIDGRTDVYSLAAMLYEMLTGDPPHTASTAQGIIAKVLTDRPRSVRAIRSAVPAHVEAAVDRALEKLPADRWATAQEFADALEGRVTGHTMARRAALGGAMTKTLRDRALIGMTLVTVAALTFAVVTARHRAPADAQPVRFTLTHDTAAPPIFNGTWSVVPSPDGRSVVYTAASTNGAPQLFVRLLDELQGRAIPGTDGASEPTFSPDGRWLAFETDGNLQKVLMSGGTPVKLAIAGANNGMDWSPRGVIVLGQEGKFSGLARVSAAGGALQEFTKVDSAKSGAAHLWPVFAEDGNTIVFALYDGKNKAGSHIGITSLDDPKVTDLGVPGIAPVGVFEGQLVYVQSDGVTMAVPVDLERRRVTGTPVPILDPVPVCPECNGDAGIHASRAGTLTYLRGSSLRQLDWLDRQGRVQSLRNVPAAYGNPRLSPDGKRLAVQIGAGQLDLWILDIASNTLSRLTSTGNNQYPEWSSDGNSIIYESSRGGKLGVWRQKADGSGTAEELAEDTNGGGVLSPDGKTLLFTRYSGSSTDIMMKTVGDATPVRPFLATPANEYAPRVSPDGHWVLYGSTETGSQEVYVRSFAPGGGRVQVSANGGGEALWSGDGRRIYYRAGRHLIAANVALSPTFRVTSRDTVIADITSKVPAAFGGGATYDVTRDGSRFVMLRGEEEGMQVVVVVNWLAELRARVARK